MPSWTGNSCIFRDQAACDFQSKAVAGQRCQLHLSVSESSIRFMCLLSRPKVDLHGGRCWATGQAAGAAQPPEAHLALARLPKGLGGAARHKSPQRFEAPQRRCLSGGQRPRLPHAVGAGAPWAKVRRPASAQRAERRGCAEHSPQGACCAGCPPARVKVVVASFMQPAAVYPQLAS
jgi:hypothetical protein